MVPPHQGAGSPLFNVKSRASERKGICMVVGKLKIASAMLGILFINGCGQMMAQRNGGTGNSVATQRPAMRMRAVSAEPGPELRIPAASNQSPKAPAPAEVALVPLPPIPKVNQNSSDVVRTNNAAVNNTSIPDNPNANSTNQVAIASSNIPKPNNLVSPFGVLGVSDNNNTTPKPAEVSADPTRNLYHKTMARLATLDSYVVRLVRKEVINNKKKPQETLLLKYRKAPLSIYFKWLDSEGIGREVVYVEGMYENKIHTLLAAGDVPFMPAGKRMAFAPDSILVRSASRHNIKDAGFVPLVEGLGRAIIGQSKGDMRFGTVKYTAANKRPEFGFPVESLEHFIPVGVENELPKGGRRVVCFDPQSSLPMLIITFDENNQEVEYYKYDRFQFPTRLDENDFNPDYLWSKPKLVSGSKL